ncbi:unnamed protein product [Cochlearia groenlandica]
MVTTISSSSNKVGPEVFINFRGAELRKSFISHLHSRLKRDGINAFIDSDEAPGQRLCNLFTKIEESKIALAVLSSRYTESHWCLEELVKMNECSMKFDQGCNNNNNLLVIPIFYKLKTSTVAKLEGKFGTNLWNLWRLPGRGRDRDNRIVKWNEALEDVLSKNALILLETGKEDQFLTKIVNHVKNALNQIPPIQQSPKPQNQEANENPKPQQCPNNASNNTESSEQRLKQVEAKIDMDCNDDETRIVGVVGMAGIGKTYLTDKLFFNLKKKFNHCVFIKFEREKANEQGTEWIEKRLAEGLLKQDRGSENPLEVSNGKDSLINKKVAIVLDNVSDKKHIDEVMTKNEWLTKGSRIVITTQDKSLLKGLSCKIYEVPGLNERESLELFRAQICTTTLEGSFLEMSRKFVDFAGGNPLALKELAKELHEKDEDQWKELLGTLTKCSNNKIREELKLSYDNLTVQHKDAFLDITCFFRSQGEDYVRTLLDSFDHELSAFGTEVKDLADKFLIGLCNGRVEMHDLVFTVARELIENPGSNYWLYPSTTNAESIDAMGYKEGQDMVRGIVLDMSTMEEMPLESQAFVGMRNLRYLKVYSSVCPNHCETECTLNLPDGLEFPKENIVRYFEWIKFPGKELPSSFEPKNLIDLRLPYSKITRVWEDTKLTPNLKWVNLRHSSRLSSISSISKAHNLSRLNLEGCTSLKELHEDMKEMKCLVFLNLRGCTSLSSLPTSTIESLKTLILSGCSNLRIFRVLSKNLETLFLNGTAIVELPLAIGDLQRLKFLDLKDCKNLLSLPDSLGKLKSLQELILSRCIELKSFPDVALENLRVLLLDGTSITEMPRSTLGFPLLRRLCLSKNDKIRSIEFDMSQMFHLKWLDLKHCKNLTSLPRLPPNLQCLNAYGCTSLRTVASPIAFLTPTEQIHSTFTFTNCFELEQASKNAIVSYIHKKSASMSNDRYNKDFVFKPLISVCFPGCEIPSCFNHQALGEILKLELPQECSRFIGIALCVVVSFKDYKDQNNSTLQVKCTSEFTNTPLSQESFVVGGWSEPGNDEPTHTIESDHIFIGYTTLFKHQNFSSANEVSLRFEVTNGTSVVKGCKVVKCGFSLVYKYDESENTTWEDTTLMMEDDNRHILV